MGKERVGGDVERHAQKGVRRALVELARQAPLGHVELEEAMAGSESHRSEEHTSELQSRQYLVCRLLLEKKKNTPDEQAQNCYGDDDHRQEPRANVSEAKRARECPGQTSNSDLTTTTTTPTDTSYIGNRE